MRTNIKRSAARRLALLLGTSALAFSTPASGASTDWTDGTGDWMTAANWSAGIPGASDVATIGNGGTAQISTGMAQASAVNITNGGTLAFLGGGLNASNIYVGSSAGASFSAGTLLLASPASPGAAALNLNGTLRATTTVTAANAVNFNAGTDSTVSAAAGTTLNLTGPLAFNTIASDTIYIGSASDTGTVSVSGPATAGTNPGRLEVVGGTLKDVTSGIGPSSFALALGTLQSVTIDSGATLQIDSSGNGRSPSTETYIKLLGSGDLVIGPTAASPRVVLGDSVFSGRISSSGYVGIGGGTASAPTATAVLTGDNNTAVEFQIGNHSTLQIGDGGTTGSLASSAIVVGYSGPLYGGNAVFKLNRSDDISLSNRLYGSLVLQQSGNGVLSVTGANQYDGISSFRGSVVVTSGGLRISDNNNLNGAPIALYSGTTLYTSSSFFPDIISFTSPVTIAGETTFSAGGVGKILWQGSISDGASVGTLQITGGGTLILDNGSNSYSGGTVVKNGSMLQIDADHEIGNPAGGLTLGDASSAACCSLERLSTWRQPAVSSWGRGAAR